MPLYNTTNMPQMAQAAMSGATQAAASQTKETKTVVKKDNSLMDDIYKGAATVALVGRGLDSITDAAQGAMKLYDQHKLRDAYDAVDKAYRDGGMGAVQKLDTNFWNNTAIGQFMKDRANNEKGRLEMLSSMDAVADKQYQDLRPMALQAAKLYQSGNIEQFMPLMQTISEKFSMPYKLEPSQNGGFKLLFRSDEKGGWTDTGRTMTGDEAYSELSKMMRGEQMIIRGMNGELLPVNRDVQMGIIRNMWNTQEINAANRTDPKKLIPLYDKNGNVGGFARIQNPIPTPEDPDAYGKNSQVMAFDNNGQGIGTFDGYEGIMKYGLSPFAPKKGKGGAGSGAAGEGGGYSLTQGDIHIIQEYFTSKNAEGEKEVNRAGNAFLEAFIQEKGLSPLQAIAAYDENKKRAIAAGAPPELADRIVMTEMAKGMRVGQREQSPQHGQSEQSPQQSPSQPQQQNPKAQGRIQGVLGIGMPGGQQAPQASPPQNSTPPTSPALPMAGLNLKGSLTSYSKNGVTQWAVIGPDGQPQEITPEQAQAYGRQIDIAARQERQAQGQRNMERMWGGNSHHGGRVTARDVWNELSEEEKSNWRSTGNLPGRYNQVR